MKLSIIVITTFFTGIQLLSASAGAAQDANSIEVKLELKDALLTTVFKKIEEQTHLRFIYRKGDVAGVQHLNFSAARGTTVASVLKTVLANTRLGFKQLDNHILIERAETNAAPRKTGTGPATGATLFEASLPENIVKGRVLNEKGEPVAGVGVMVKGTRKGVTTNENGEFEVKGLKANAILVFSSIGYEKTEASIDGRSFVVIKLKIVTKLLDEVNVVASTGYQIISKERATGAYDVVGQNLLASRGATNLSTLLQGTVAGLQAKENMDGSSNFLIRGTSSLYANTQPLIVVDGFPVATSDFSTINLNDVESVTVLKDAAAASIWGARSANGVIVITTKQAKAGKLNVEFNAFTTVSNLENLDQIVAQANSANQVKYERTAWDSSWFFNKYAGSFSDISKPLTLAQEFLVAKENGLITSASLSKSLDSLANISNQGQIRKYLMQHAVLSQYNLMLSGATDKSRTSASVLYEKNKGGYVGNSYNKYMMNFSHQIKAASYLTVSLQANMLYKKREASGTSASEIQGLSPYETLLNPDGSYSVNLNSWNRQQLSLLPLSSFPYSDWSYNLLREVRGRRIISENLNVRVQAGVTIKILKGLNWDNRVQYEKQKSDTSSYYSDGTFYTRNIVNTMVVYNNTTRVVGISYLPKGGILQSSTGDAKNYVLRSQLNFNQHFASKHDVTAIVGTEISEYRIDTKTNPWLYGYYPDKLQSTVPVYGYGSSSDLFTNFMGSTATISGGAAVLGYRLDRYVSAYGNAAYTYNEKYTLSASVRSDASNYITDNPKLRWSPLWSVGAMWNILKEPFMRGSEIFDRLNFRVTYGKNGNAEKSTSTKTLLSVSTTISATTGTTTASVADYGNPSLRWEKTTTTNAGIDFSMFKSKVFGKIDVYNKLGSDITGQVSLPSADGTTSQKFNNAKLINRGLELTVGVNVRIPNTPVYYTTSVTYAYNYNRIKNLFYPSYYAYQILGGSFIEGKPVNSVYSFTYKGMINGVPNVAGTGGSNYPMTSAALYNTGLGLNFLNYEGTGTPPHTLGWVNSIKVHNFDLLVLFVGTFGGVYRNPTFNYATATVGSSKTFVNKFISDVYAGNTAIPGFAKSNDTQIYLWDRYVPYLHGLVESSSYIQCKEITAGYSLGKAVSHTIQMSNIRVYGQVRNPGMVWHANSKGYNPDWLPGSDMPVTNYTFGINFQL